MSRNRRRSFGFAVISGSALVAACSVDTSGIAFLDQDTYDRETMSGTGDVSAGDQNAAAGDPGTGGSDNVGGTTSKAGSTGKSGSGSGGSTATGGKASGGSDGVGGVVGTGGKAGAGSGGQVGFGGAGGLPPGGGPAGGMGTGGQMQCPPLFATRGAPLIDDFEDGNAGLPMPMQSGRAGGWYTTNDGSSQQMPPPGQPPNPMQNIFQDQVDASKYALHTAGGGFLTWGADVGTSFLTIPNNKVPCPYDISVHTGLRFSVRGKISDDILRVSILTVETDSVEQGGTCVPVGTKMCDDHYSYFYGPITDNWTVVSIPFSRLAQQQFGVAEEWVPKHALGLEFGFHGGGQTSFDVWIDDVQFY